MSQDYIDAEHTSLAVRGEVVDEAPQGNLALFGTTDPVDVVARATRVADALKSVIVQKGLVSNIQGKQYPQVEAWQTLAVMLGIAAVCEWTREIENGWEARVVAQRNGVTIAAAEAQCTRDERSWKSRDAYALRSMAQTRAVSKALRSVLGFVMVLAGYQATPAEEVPSEGFSDRKERAAPKAPPTESADQTEKRRAAGIKGIHAFCTNRGISDAEYRQVMREAFPDVFTSAAEPSSKELSLEQLQRLSRYLQEFVRDREPA